MLDQAMPISYYFGDPRIFFGPKAHRYFSYPQLWFATSYWRQTIGPISSETGLSGTACNKTHGAVVRHDRTEHLTVRRRG